MMTRRLTGALLGVALALAGCAGRTNNDGHDVATAGGTSHGASASASAAPADEAEKQRQFARCMRDNGIDMPDPKSDGNGGFGIQIGGDGSNPPDRAKVDAAMQKCKQYLPNGGEPPKQDPAQQEKVRQYAKCMRDNGVPNFPDPQSGGGLMIGPDQGLDPNDPTFKAADEKCRQYLPGLGASGGPGTNSRTTG
jgi:hypothetical protein